MKQDRYLAGHLAGLLDALKTVAEITGPIRMEDINQETWSIICAINIKLSGMAAEEAGRLEE